MAYIGVQPTDTYLSIASQQITGTGSATYTLDYSVSTEEDVAVFVNNVRQNVSSYTVSGTSLTLGGTISASDSCWVLFLGRTVGTKTPAVGSVTNDMLAGSIANAKLANSSITLNGSAVSLGGSATVGGNNTPAFEAYKGSNQSGISEDTNTLLTLDTEIFDSGQYDTSTYKFTPAESGKYLVYLQIGWRSWNTSSGSVKDQSWIASKLYKNASSYCSGSFTVAVSNLQSSMTSYVQAIMDLNTTDYVQPYAMHQNNSGNTAEIFGNYFYTRFGAFKLIGA